MKVGVKIKNLRLLKNYTQTYMADNLDISQSFYNKIENENTNITFKRLEEISAILEVEPLDLLQFDEMQYFNKVKNSQIGSGNYVHKSFSQEEKQLYTKRIQHLEEEVLFLRKLLENFQK